jgi:hypothetical protein
VAMTILAVGTVSIVSLFAAAVQIQYQSSIEDEVALLLPHMEAIAQDHIDRFYYAPDDPVPAAVPATDIPGSPGFRYELKFQSTEVTLPGEGFWVKLRIFPPGDGPVWEPPRMWFLKRQVFSKEELETSITYDEEQRGGDDRRARDRRLERD